MGVFNLFSLIGIGTAAIFREGTKHVIPKNNNDLRSEAIKRGEKIYYDKDGIPHDTVLDYELKYVNNIPGYSGCFTTYANNYVLDCYEHDRYFEIREEASCLNKKYFVVNVMDYFHRELYSKNTLFFIVENKVRGVVYKVYSENKIIKVTSFYRKGKEDPTLYHDKTFTPNKEWLEKFLSDSYIPNDIFHLTTANYVINGVPLIPWDKFQGLCICEYPDDNTEIIVGFHVLGNTYHGYLNRIKIGKIINDISSEKYDLSKIKNILNDIVTEEEFYNEHEKSHIDEYQIVFKKAIETMKEDIDVIDGIINGTINIGHLEDVVKHLTNIIS